MNKHLKLVCQLNDIEPFSQAVQSGNKHLSDMDIVMLQALLMNEGSAVLKAIKTGEMVEILSGLVNLAYYALSAIAMQGGEAVDRPITWRHDGFVLSVMRVLSDKINQCTSGKSVDYSEVYCLCIHLTRSFINADFDQAFQAIHAGKIAKSVISPDLSDYLYE
jgi:hypothetical protein